MIDDITLPTYSPGPSTSDIFRQPFLDNSPLIKTEK